MWLLFIKCSLYNLYNIIFISSMFMWPDIHLDIPALMLPKHTDNINTGISRYIQGVSGEMDKTSGECSLC